MPLKDLFKSLYSIWFTKKYLFSVMDYYFDNLVVFHLKKYIILFKFVQKKFSPDKRKLNLLMFKIKILLMIR